MLLTRDSCQLQWTAESGRAGIEETEKITFDANENQNRAGLDILMTEKIYFNFKNF